jgi:hypothetical protein
MISKELLNTVLNVDLKDINGEPTIFFRGNMLLGVDEENNTIFHINIYELANKIKTWAYTKNYHLESELKDDFWFCRAVNLATYGGYDYEAQYKYSEPEAIFESGEWVLEQVKGKK